MGNETSEDKRQHAQQVFEHINSNSVALTVRPLRSKHLRNITYGNADVPAIVVAEMSTDRHNDQGWYSARHTEFGVVPGANTRFCNTTKNPMTPLLKSAASGVAATAAGIRSTCHFGFGAIHFSRQASAVEARSSPQFRLILLRTAPIQALGTLCSRYLPVSCLSCTVELPSFGFICKAQRSVDTAIIPTGLTQIT